jgi:hypothetical protein
VRISRNASVNVLLGGSSQIRVDDFPRAYVQCRRLLEGVRMRHNRAEKGGCYVNSSNSGLSAHTQHYGRRGIIESFCYMPKYLRHGRQTNVQKMQPHRAAAISAEAITQSPELNSTMRRSLRIEATGHGLLHAIVDDGKRNILEPEDFLSVVVRDKRTVHLADAKLKGISAAKSSI